MPRRASLTAAAKLPPRATAAASVRLFIGLPACACDEFARLSEATTCCGGGVGLLGKLLDGDADVPGGGNAAAGSAFARDWRCLSALRPPAPSDPRMPYVLRAPTQGRVPTRRAAQRPFRREANWLQPLKPARSSDYSVHSEILYM